MHTLMPCVNLQVLVKMDVDMCCYRRRTRRTTTREAEMTTTTQMIRCMQLLRLVGVSEPHYLMLCMYGHAIAWLVWSSRYVR
jgi:hypothetical protein